MATTALARRATGSSRPDEYVAAEAHEIVSQLQGDFAKRDKLYQRIDDIIHGRIRPVIPEGYRRIATTMTSPLAAYITNTTTAALSSNPFTVTYTPTGIGVGARENATQRKHFFEASWVRQQKEARRRLGRLFMYSLVTRGEGVLKTMERTNEAWASYAPFQQKTWKDLYSDRSLDADSRGRLWTARTEQYKREAPYPIVTTDVPPSTFRYLKGASGFTAACEIKEVPYLEALATFNKHAEAGGRPGVALDGAGNVVSEATGLGRPQSDWSSVMGGHKTIAMQEIWTWDKLVYLLAGPNQAAKGRGRGFGRGQPVQVLEGHGYGDPATRTLRGPYFHALGLQTDSRLPENAGLSILYPFLDLFPVLDTLLTIALTNSIMTGFASFKRNKPEGATAPRTPGTPGEDYGDDGLGEASDYDYIEPGAVYPYDIGPLEMPRAGVDFHKMIEIIRGFLDLALPSVLRGGLSDSGYALNQAAYLAGLSFDPITDNSSFALGERVGFESWLIENRVEETVYAWGAMPLASRVGRRQQPTAGWIGLGPDDLNGVHAYEVHVEPKTPSDKAMEERFHESMVNAEFETRADAVLAMGGNPDEVQSGVLFEKFQKRPEIEDQLMKRVLQRLGAAEQSILSGAQEAETGMDQANVAAALGSDGQVYAPGAGMPETPTPGGSLTGVGPNAPILRAQGSIPGQDSGIRSAPPGAAPIGPGGGGGLPTGPP